MSLLATSIADLLKPSPSPSPSPKQSSLDLTVLIGVVSGIVTIVTAILATTRFFSRSRRRKERVDRRIDEIVQRQLEAEDIEESVKEAEEHAKKAEDELARLREVRDDLSHQISQLPQEADRLFLGKQLEQLAERLSKDFREYISIERKLQAPKTAGLLDARIREIIEQDMLPVMTKRERLTTYVFVLLILSLAINLSPIRVSGYIWDYFNILSDSLNWTTGSQALMIALGSLVIALFIFGASSLSTTIENYLLTLGKYRFVISLSLALVIAVILGYAFRDAALAALANSCYPISCGFPNGPFTGADISFNVAPVLGGILLVAIVNTRRNRSANSKLLAKPRHG